MRTLDETTGVLMGALADVQAQRVQALLAEAGVTVTYREFPTVGHSMHGTEPDLYVDTLLDWVATLS
jgi:predicted esterase